MLKRKWILGAALGCLLVALPAIAQPGGGGGGRGMGGGGGRGMMGGGLSPEQVLGMLAFDDEYAVTDEQLVKLRAGLKATYVKQQNMMADMASGGDWQAMRETMRENMENMREEVMATLGQVLNEEQLTKFNQQMEEAQARRGQWGGGGQRGGGGGGQWGGGGGGGGGGQRGF